MRSMVEGRDADTCEAMLVHRLIADPISQTPTPMLGSHHIGQNLTAPRLRKSCVGQSCRTEEEV